jgi:hypothetical protein
VTENQKPGPERLLGVRVAATDDGGARMTIHTRATDGTIYVGEIVIDEPYVADMLRRAVLNAIPDRPHVKADMTEIQRRLARIAE